MKIHDASYFPYLPLISLREFKSAIFRLLINGFQIIQNLELFVGVCLAACKLPNNRFENAIFECN
jgi:hypothetical protein